jgi:hypothetical protein
MPLFQPSTKVRAVAVAEPVIHDRARQAIMLNENESVPHGRRHRGVSPCLLQGCSNIHGDQKFVLNNKDRATPEPGVFHDGTYARLSANARGRSLFLVGRRVPSRRSILNAQQA